MKTFLINLFAALLFVLMAVAPFVLASIPTPVRPIWDFSAQ
jgi:hypothetical protein